MPQTERNRSASKPRLAALPGRVALLAPRVGYLAGDEAERERYRNATQHWRHLYRSAKWQRIREATFVRDAYTCKLCRRVITRPEEAICDHVYPHNGNLAAFWQGPFQTLCTQCHGSAKQRTERRHE